MCVCDHVHFTQVLRLLSQQDPWSHIHTCGSMPVITSTSVRGSFSIETLVSYLAYLLGLDHSRTRTVIVYFEALELHVGRPQRDRTTGTRLARYQFFMWYSVYSDIRYDSTLRSN